MGGASTIRKIIRLVIGLLSNATMLRKSCITIDNLTGGGAARNDPPV